MQLKLILLGILSFPISQVFPQTSKGMSVRFSGLQVSLKSANKTQPLNSGELVSTKSILEAKGKGEILLVNQDEGAGCIIQIAGFKKISMDTLKYMFRTPSLMTNFSNLIKNYVHKPRKLVSTSIHKAGIYNYYPMLFPADDERLLGQQITFSWLKDARVRYEFVLEKGEQQAIPIKYSKDTLICFNINNCSNKYTFQEGVIYYWTIQDSRNDKDSIYLVEFRLANSQEINSVMEDLAQLDSEKGDLDYELYVCLKTTVYENHKMYSEAYNVYKEFLNDKGPDSIVWSMFQKFMARMAGKNQKPN